MLQEKAGIVIAWLSEAHDGSWFFLSLHSCRILPGWPFLGASCLLGQHEWADRPECARAAESGPIRHDQCQVFDILAESKALSESSVKQKVNFHTLTLRISSRALERAPRQARVSI